MIGHEHITTIFIQLMAAMSTPVKTHPKDDGFGPHSCTKEKLWIKPLCRGKNN